MPGSPNQPRPDSDQPYPDDEPDNDEFLAQGKSEPIELGKLYPVGRVGEVIKRHNTVLVGSAEPLATAQAEQAKAEQTMAARISADVERLAQQAKASTRGHDTAINVTDLVSSAVTAVSVPVTSGRPNRWCPKYLHEALANQQTYAPDDYTRTAIGELLALLELHRPLGADGKHDDRHTPTCGCEDEQRVMGSGYGGPGRQ